MDNITVYNEELGEVELELVKHKQGAWSYYIVTINGDCVLDGMSDPMPKKSAQRQMKHFGRNCTYIVGLGYCVPINTETQGE